MREMNMKVNRLPQPTWNWLKMNSAAVAASLGGDGRVSVQLPDGMREDLLKVSSLDVDTGMGADLDALVKASGVPVRRYVADGSVAEPLRLNFAFDDASSVNAVEIVTAPGSDLTVVMDYRSAEKASVFAAVQTKLSLGDGATIHLVQIQRLGDSLTFCNDVGARCGENSRLELLQLFLGGARTYTGSACALDGADSSLKCDLGYLVKGEQQLDMNYLALHRGRKTVSELNASGVLRGHGSKLFRGTIDFRRGAVGAVGNEKEDALLMDDTVINRTIPLILCSEENVEGNHGATIGRLDDATLFYLESRGLTREEVYETVAQARLMALCRKIKDAPTRADVARWLKGGEEYDA